MSSFCLLKKNKDIEIVTLGFSWKAFFLSFIWGLAHKVWRISLIWTLLFLCLSFFYFIQLIHANVILLFMILSSVFWGFFGNDLIIINFIERQFYKPLKIIFSSSQKSALLIYFSENKL